MALELQRDRSQTLESISFSAIFVEKIVIFRNKVMNPWFDYAVSAGFLGQMAQSNAVSAEIESGLNPDFVETRGKVA
jgi:hypothetical protein